MTDRTLRILLVEDDDDDYVITRDLLDEISETQPAITWVNRGDEAVPAIAAGTHDVVLLDYRLGERTGLEVLREAIAAGSKTPIILLTGQGDRDVDVEAMKAGAADYLVKGHIDAGLLERSIRYAIGRAQTLEIRERQIAAEASNRARSEFLAMVSHEIRSPLGVVLGYVDLLFDADPPAEQRELLEPIRRSAEHLRALVNDVLDLSKIEAGKLAVEQLDCSPAEVVNEVASMVRASADEAGVHLEVGVGSGVPRTIRTDPTRLRQILLNLVGNAIKFARGGRVDFRLALGADDPERLRFDVHDTGIGLEPEQIGRLFEPFAQADASTARCFAGTGLGLAISKRLARLLGGDIAVESRPGEGSTFTLEMPPSGCPA